MISIKNILRATIISSLIATVSFGVQTKDIDEGFTSVKLSNNKANILNFPFKVKTAKVIAQVPENFQTKATGTSIVVMPTTQKKNERADLLVTSRDDYTFIINLSTGSMERVFNFTSNKVQTATPAQQKFESGKIDNDMKRLLKKVILEKKVPGYKKLEVKRQFHTKDMLMQKDFILDGGKYRVEKWFIKNKSFGDTIVLDEGNFYTKGILAITFEVPKIKPGNIATMWIVVNKSSFKKDR